MVRGASSAALLPTPEPMASLSGYHQMPPVGGAASSPGLRAATRLARSADALVPRYGVGSLFRRRLLAERPAAPASR
ncbi:MAG: hypothetical protein BGO98_13255 [Myxococcales bacterium 68-20]|nr:MAG: hypothetical protein BGO98_13255 [Myxococcales bacterium 68-20]